MAGEKAKGGKKLPKRTGNRAGAKGRGTARHGAAGGRGRHPARNPRFKPGRPEEQWSVRPGSLSIGDKACFRPTERGGARKLLREQLRYAREQLAAREAKAARVAGGKSVGEGS